MNQILIKPWQKNGIQLKGNRGLLSALRFGSVFSINGVFAYRVVYSYNVELDVTQWLLLATLVEGIVPDLNKFPMIKLDPAQARLLLAISDGTLQKATAAFREQAALAATSLQQINVGIDPAEFKKLQRAISGAYTSNPELAAKVATALDNYRAVQEIGGSTLKSNRAVPQWLKDAEINTRPEKYIDHNPLKPPQRRISLEDDV